MPFKWFTRHFWKISVVSLVVIVSYLVYLDAQIQPRFEGNKWEVPAQIFARPLSIEKGEEISKQEILDELKLLGYRATQRADEVGEYSSALNKLIIYRREFYYPDHTYPAQKVLIEWDGARISSIQAIESNTRLRRTSLEPWLVSRLVGGLDEDRMLVGNADIPSLLKASLITVEDRDFYEHFGVAPLSILRALIANITAGRTVQGGSTLTQQLVKNLFLTRERSYVRKLKEAAMALVIDARYSKDEILNAYINEVFLGQNGAVAIHGFGLASHYFFNRPLNELGITEIATLVGMVKGPSYYDPIRHPERSTERRNLVLRLLFENYEISKEEYEKGLNTPLITHDNPALASGKHPAFMDKIRSELKSVVQTKETRLSGVKVFTTLDINAQRRAEAALVNVVAQKRKAYKQPALQGALVVSDIKSGGIRAIVGSMDTTYAGFNRALNAKRPIGSLIKPVIYLSALEDPFTFNLASQVDDKPITYDDANGEKWRPLNADKKFRQSVNLMDAIVHSYNVPSVNIAAKVGFDEVVSTISRLGVQSDAKPLPSIALGAVEMSPLNVNQIYQTISNNGELRPLYALYAVSTHDNALIWKHQHRSQNRADEDATYLLNYALHKVTKEGTAKAIGKTFSKINMAGKTGTTDDYRDSWFSGFDRNLVTTVWLGNDNNAPINMSGATGALPVFIEFQKKMSPKSLVRRFPESLTIAHFDKSTGNHTLARCDDVLSVPAIKYALADRVSCPDSSGQSTVLEPEEKEKKKSWWERLFS